MEKNSEQKFIHDLSSPLTVVQGGLDILLLKIKNGQITSLDQVVERVEKLIDNSDKVVKLLQERKKSLRDNK